MTTTLTSGGSCNKRLRDKMRSGIFKAVLTLAALSLAISLAGAQQASPSRLYATRVELQAMLAQTVSQAADPNRSASERAQSSNDEQELRERLETGDFRVGDRIVLRIAGNTTAVDTLNVTAARSLRIPDAGDVSLEGVLRSELDDHLNSAIGRFVRNTVVRAQPLTRLAVLGEVRTPGFVHVPSQALLSDVISAAGGPTPGGNLDRGMIRRAGKQLVSSAAFARGLAGGATLDDLGIRAGDEIVIGGKRSFNWAQLAQTTAILIGSAATIIAIQNR
jgi:protein involved in polysaccharide export with SLBB domain